MTKEKNTRLSRRQQPVLGRVLGYMVRHYKFSCLAVVVCIRAPLATPTRHPLHAEPHRRLHPPLTPAQPDFGPLAAAWAGWRRCMSLGILCAYGYNRIMVNVSQGTMRNLRQELFQHMGPSPCGTLTPTPTGTSCRSTPTTWTPCGSSSARASPDHQLPALLGHCLVAMFVLSVPCPCSRWRAGGDGSGHRRHRHEGRPTISRPSSRTWAW